MAISHSYVAVYQRVMKLFMLDGITFFAYMSFICLFFVFYIHIYIHTYLYDGQR